MGRAKEAWQAIQDRGWDSVEKYVCADCVEDYALKERWWADAAQLGAPPATKASAGRMNPAGISYLYTSFDEETALLEIDARKRKSDTVLVAKFRLTEPLTVIDLTQLPELPSVFDVALYEQRESLLFAREFASEISVRVDKDLKEHIEYVPTQVVCEYLAQVFEVGESQRLGGLIFPGSVHSGGRNLVVFPSRGASTRSFHGVEYLRAHRR